ncbi:MAG: hypothetical protein HY788_14750 [Deltaproteobacteria bacterium]|nr:hypothetical protein [Deltaproteobacteria bacterium]
MRILTYKRTHTGDPDSSGRFGINTCMGRIRDYRFDAVIGIGGIGVEPKRYGIAEKINWIGIGPVRHGTPSKRASEVTFKHFVLLDDQGPNLEALAPNLAKRFYKGGARLLLEDYSDIELAEALGIIEWSKSQKSVIKVDDKATKGSNQCQISCRSDRKRRKCGCSCT